jgi:RNA polymerase sigma-70 factor (ECF subfamily)
MQQHGGKIKSHAMRLTRNTEDAEDLYQDTSIKIFMNMDKLTNESTFYSWALRIMQRTFLDKKRYDSCRPETTSFDELNAQFGSEIDFEDKKVDIESEVMLGMVKEMNSRQIRGMIKSLNPVYSATLALNTYGTVDSLDIANTVDEGLNYQEVAAVTNTTQSAVATRLQRAKEALRRVAAANSYVPIEE